ncbi:hypothetical protein TcCL_NonESM01810 [Trypanosoma cruzi]|nr:hypothetical protein TcCL_NonESM01810 [Trypanosoma cruzi]
MLKEKTRTNAACLMRGPCPQATTGGVRRTAAARRDLGDNAGDSEETAVPHWKASKIHEMHKSRSIEENCPHISRKKQPGKKRLQIPIKQTARMNCVRCDPAEQL